MVGQGTSFTRLWSRTSGPRQGPRARETRDSRSVAAGKERRTWGEMPTFCTGEHNLDSSVLVDAFEWIANGGTVTVGTVKPPA